MSTRDYPAGFRLIHRDQLRPEHDFGEALHHAYQGALEFHCNDAEKRLRVYWRR